MRACFDSVTRENERSSEELSETVLREALSLVKGKTPAEVATLRDHVLAHYRHYATGPARARYERVLADQLEMLSQQSPLDLYLAGGFFCAVLLVLRRVLGLRGKGALLGAAAVVAAGVLYVGCALWRMSVLQMAWHLLSAFAHVSGLQLATFFFVFGAALFFINLD